jgi:hypothetical protein
MRKDKGREGREKSRSRWMVDGERDPETERRGEERGAATGQSGKG